MKRLMILVLVLAAAGAAIVYLPLKQAEPQASPAAEGPTVSIGQTIIRVEPARAPAEVQKGLSGRPSLEADAGMLFIFDKPDIYSFWMPDMNFPLDMIWIGSDLRVVGVSADVSNDFDPLHPVFYHPPSPAQYVVEANAGFAARNGIGAGDLAVFRNIE